MKKIKLLALFVLFNLTNTFAQDVWQWRGPNRDGCYHDAGLLQKWTDNGPPLLWSFEGLGAGHGSVSFSRNQLFVLGMPDSTGILYAFGLDGKLIWKTEYGPEWHTNYVGTRSTPTVVDDHIYFLSGRGVVYCYHAKTGKEIWSVDILERFNAPNIRWGITESLLVDGNQLIVTPGGADHNIVSLNRFTGETLWTSKGVGENSAYCSPILVNHNSNRLIITMTASSVLCVDADTGEFYWSLPQKQRNNIHSNTPVYHNGWIFCASADAPDHNGLVAIQLADDGKSAEVKWRNKSFPNLMGGIIIQDGFIVGSQYRKKEWNVINASTGDFVQRLEGLTGGVIIFADGLFYGYNEDGRMLLMDAGADRLQVISAFDVPLGTDQHWAHPVIHMQRLFVRHGNALMVYDISR